MNLQNRFLSFKMVGDDVALLHHELTALAAQYKLMIPPDEIEWHYFGPGTQTAVIQYQKQNLKRLLALSGASGDTWAGMLDVIDRETAATINQDYDRLPLPFSVTGLIRDNSGYPVKGARLQTFNTFKWLKT